MVRRGVLAFLLGALLLLLVLVPEASALSDYQIAFQNYAPRANPASWCGSCQATSTLMTTTPGDYVVVLAMLSHSGGHVDFSGASGVYASIDFSQNGMSAVNYRLVNGLGSITNISNMVNETPATGCTWNAGTACWTGAFRLTVTGTNLTVYENETGGTTEFAAHKYVDHDLWFTSGTASYFTDINMTGTLASYYSGTIYRAGALTVVPTAPVSLGVATSGANLVLTWSPPINDGGAPITSYVVYRGTSSGTETLVTTGGCSGLGAVLTCTDAGLADGTYYYEVAAVNTVGVGALSNEARGGVGVPGAPVLSGSTDGNWFYLTWTTPSPGDSAITSYDVYQVDDATGYTVTYHPGLVNSLQVAGLTTNHSYTVRAFNVYGQGAASNSVRLIASLDLFGDHGAIYGGNVATVAAALGVSTTSTQILYGIIFVLIFAAGGLMLGLKLGFPAAAASVGAVVGVFAAMAFGFFPVWVVVFLAMGAAAVAILFLRGRGSSS